MNKPIKLIINIKKNNKKLFIDEFKNNINYKFKLNNDDFEIKIDKDVNALSNKFTSKTNESIFKGSIFMIDLKLFKELNEMYGLATGDKILKKTLERLTIFSDSAEVFFGDVFIIKSNLTKEKDIKKALIILTELIEMPIKINNNTILISCAIGVSINNKNNYKIERMIINAETALNYAKKHKVNKIYNESLSIELQRRVKIQHDLRIAIKQKDFKMKYQPQKDIKTDELSGYEGLIRWNKYSPDEFIPIAEEAGLMKELGFLVLDMCISKAAEINLPIAINVSPKQLIDMTTIEFIKKLLKKYKCDPSLIILEITETSIIDNTLDIIGKLNILKQIGFKIALDDFGTGYSSLSYLQKMPIDILKIDKSFINDLINNSKNKIVLQGIIDLGHGLGFEILAEGVETTSQYNLLKDLNCNKIQGFLYGKPDYIKEIK